MKTVLLLLACLLALPNPLQAATYGPANESATTTGTQLTSGGSWQNSLQTASSGTTFLLRAGTYNASGDITITATNITVKPYNQESVTVNGRWVLNGQPDGLTIAGLTLQGGSNQAAIQTTADGTNNVTIRNNVVRGGTLCAIRLKHAMDGLQILGNDIDNNVGNSGPNSALEVSAGAFDAGNTQAFNNWLIKGNKLQSHVNEDVVTLRQWGGTCIFEDNYFPGTTSGVGDAELMDVKSPYGSTATLIIRRNIFLPTTGNSSSIILHGDDPIFYWPSGTTCRVEDNYFENSGATCVRIGETGEPGGKVILRRNVIKSLTTGSECLGIYADVDGNIIEQNSFYGGLLKFQTSASPAALNPNGNILRNNVFHTMTFQLNNASVSSFTKNTFYNSTPPSQSTNHQILDPQFVNISTRDFNTQASAVVDAGTTETDSPFNGTAHDHGALEPPVLVSAEVGAVAADKIVCTWQNNIASPLSAVTNGLFSATVAGSARTISSTAIVGVNQTYHTLASAVAAGQSVTITANYGAIKDSAKVGGPELNLNANSKVKTNFPVVNNVGSGGGGTVVNAGAGFTNTPFTNQTGSFTVVFDATPSAATIDALAALSNGAAAANTDLATIVRFAPTGVIQARNGGTYTAATTINYSGGITYRIKMVVNIPAHTYSAYVTPAGGSQVTIGTNYAFRTEQSSVTQLNNWAAVVNSASGSMTIGAFTFYNIATAGGGFVNAAMPAKTGTFTGVFDAIPSDTTIDAIVGFSNGPASAFTDLATIIRFAPTGVIQARNGGTYTAAATINYSANVNYHLRLVVNVPNHTYSAYVTPDGGSEVTIGVNYAFRTEQTSVTQLSNIGAVVNSASGSLLVSDWSW